MKNINELVESVSYPSRKTSNDLSGDRERSSDRRADRVWSRMGEMYGKRWFREYGMSPSETWIAAIQRMSDESIKRALTNLAQSGGEHPPTLPAFVTAGSKSAGLGLDYTPEYYREPEFTPAALIEKEPTEEEKEHARLVRETAVAECLRLLAEGKKRKDKMYADKRNQGEQR